ncbi:twin-arginine translocation signal domain-containing protein [Streptomyces acidiscabies]|uniref:twin-arginine translocation signal domain-containing protein n=1 Tax=Streptomyces acidiscabies TaxID=42234 RepID=UPI0038D4887C
MTRPSTAKTPSSSRRSFVGGADCAAGAAVVITPPSALAWARWSYRRAKAAVMPTSRARRCCVSWSVLRFRGQEAAGTAVTRAAVRRRVSLASGSHRDAPAPEGHGGIAL